MCSRPLPDSCSPRIRLTEFELANSLALSHESSGAGADGGGLLLTSESLGRRNQNPAASPRLTTTREASTRMPRRDGRRPGGCGGPSGRLGGASFMDAFVALY